MANLKVREGLTSTINKEILPHVGAILTYAGPTAPNGWLLCNGSTFDQTLYPKLYELLGDSNTLPDLREKYLIGKGSGSLNLNTNTGSNNHTHTYSYAGNNSDNQVYPVNVAATHYHGIVGYSHPGEYSGSIYFGPRDYTNGARNGTNLTHAHYSYVDVGIDGYGNNAANYRAGNSQNMTTQNHAHSTGGNAYGSNASNQNHAHYGVITRNDGSSPSHTHVVATSNTGTISSDTPINNPVTIYLNFIIKAG